MNHRNVAFEMVKKNFYVISNYVGFKGVKSKETQKQFNDLESIAKQTALIGVESAISAGFCVDDWEKVKQEIEKL